MVEIAISRMNGFNQLTKIKGELKMALEKTTQLANRYGLNTKLYAFGTYGEEAEPVMNIDFVNLSEISIEGDTVWATGGQAGSNKVGFNNPMTGSFKLSTQIVTSEILTLLAGKDVADATNTIVFENTADGTISPYYTITSETVWQDEKGNKYSQDLIFHKAKAKRALNIQYNGSGDPISLDIEFELATDEDDKLLTITNSDVEAA